MVSPRIRAIRAYTVSTQTNEIGIRLALGAARDQIQAIVLRETGWLAFVYGDFEDLDPQHPHVFAYTRTLGSEKYLIV